MDANKNEKKNNNKYMIAGIVLMVLVIAIAGICAYFIINNKDKKDTELAYTDLIKKMSDGDVEKVEMTVGSTSVKVKLRNEEDERNSIVPNTQAFIELVQEKVAEGNEIELIQKRNDSMLSKSQDVLEHYLTKEHNTERILQKNETIKI